LKALTKHTHLFREALDLHIGLSLSESQCEYGFLFSNIRQPSSEVSKTLKSRQNSLKRRASFLSEASLGHSKQPGDLLSSSLQKEIRLFLQ
jgi:hypothetical protein